MTVNPADWRPGASLDRLRRRAALLAGARAFFAARGLLEVDTPQLVNFAVTDLQLHSAEVHWPSARAAFAAASAAASPRSGQAPRYLHTSPEYAMKRLLAAGSGDIYQLCHVFRGEEQGPLHNSEFMMLEWYRRNWTLAALMNEVDELLRELVNAAAGTQALDPARCLSYEQAFLDIVDCNPLTDADAVLADCACAHGLDATAVRRCGRDELLDFLMGTQVGPRLGAAGPVFVHRYPASQAALACLAPDDPRVALRFELYLRGVELANGFEELADAAEQRARFLADQRARAARGLSVPPMDEFLLAALAAGLPACSGVALGIDRVLMLACGARRLDEVMAFTSDRA